MLPVLTVLTVLTVQSSPAHAGFGALVKALGEVDLVLDASAALDTTLIDELARIDGDARLFVADADGVPFGLRQTEAGRWQVETDDGIDLAQFILENVAGAENSGEFGDNLRVVPVGCPSGDPSELGALAPGAAAIAVAGSAESLQPAVQSAQDAGVDLVGLVVETPCDEPAMEKLGALVSALRLIEGRVRLSGGGTFASHELEATDPLVFSAIWAAEDRPAGVLAATWVVHWEAVAPEEPSDEPPLWFTIGFVVLLLGGAGAVVVKRATA